MTMPDLVAKRDVNALNEWLEAADPLEIAEELARLAPPDRAVPFRLLPKDRALEVFEALDPLHQQELLEGLRETSVRQLFEDMDPDDRARLVDEMPAKVAKQLLGGLSQRERSLTATLLGYPENSAGRVMSPEVVNLKANQTAADAMARLRRIGGNAETIYALPVTDDQRRLVGALGLRDLVLANPETRVGDLMDKDVYSGRVNQDQEEIARLIQEADLLALPIVDTEDRLVGIVTVDDAMRILEEEQTEDVARAGGSEPLEHPYLSTSVLGLARSRIVWLMVLIVAATLTVNVLSAFESTLGQVVTLALFIPLIIGTGGNAGSQSATTVTRALAVGELRTSDVALVVVREGRVGLLLGAMLSLIAFLPTLAFVSYSFGVDIGERMAIVVSLTLLIVCTLATLVGSTLPLLARRMGFDPAVMSAPFISTLIDASGLIVYFLIAKTVLGI
ncbi:MAG: magnesium transporter [Candidatus Limnocylindrales bacterium]